MIIGVWSTADPTPTEATMLACHMIATSTFFRRCLAIGTFLGHSLDILLIRFLFSTCTSYIGLACLFRMGVCMNKTIQNLTFFTCHSGVCFITNLHIKHIEIMIIIVMIIIIMIMMMMMMMMMKIMMIKMIMTMIVTCI